MKNTELNCDMGEGFGSYDPFCDKEILPYITQANIACGAHAGDPVKMRRAVRLCAEHGVKIGAHPGFFDLMGFGRREMKVTPDEAAAYLTYQVGALSAFCSAEGIRLCHVKPHGALYNMAAKDEKLSCALAEAVYAIDPELVFVGLSGSCMISEAKKVGLATMSEVFADRAYNDDGSLVARSLPGSVIYDEDEALSRTLRMLRHGEVVSISGKVINIDADTVCLHGDSPKAVAFAKKINEALNTISKQK